MRRALQEPAAGRQREPLEVVAEMMREGLGLRLLLAKMPPGSTLEDARRLRERIKQSGRRPSGVLDAAAGVERD
jgi:hypothetical protein